jgi:hypothetical protein
MRMKHGQMGDDVVALVEILSPGDMAKKRALRSFLDKVMAALVQEITCS